MRSLRETECPAELRAGMTVTSPVGSTSVIVLRVGNATHPPFTDGREMAPGRPTPCGIRVRRGERTVQTVAGRRYVDPPTGLTVQCTRSGSGWLSYDGRRMMMMPLRPAGR
jgi:hypothetical protein